MADRRSVNHVGCPPQGRDVIYDGVVEVLVDALCLDEEDVSPRATLRSDLGAESIDFLDIVFRLEKKFQMKIPRGEIFVQEEFASCPEFVQPNSGIITPRGLAELKRVYPYVEDWTLLETSPLLSNLILDVQWIVCYVKYKKAHPEYSPILSITPPRKSNFSIEPPDWSKKE